MTRDPRFALGDRVLFREDQPATVTGFYKSGDREEPEYTIELSDTSSRLAEGLGENRSIRAFECELTENLSYGLVVKNFPHRVIDLVSGDRYRELQASHDALLELVGFLAQYASDTHTMWDNDQDVKVGKRLLAMAGIKGYSIELDSYDDKVATAERLKAK